ncbi:MAG: cytochrome c biogenesis protein CcsA [Bdellovibrionaceae bacterium]|nr:cytochrome c biogenesis protein CcsA [Pseudobdellovibrionaceae bacterium]
MKTVLFKMVMTSLLVLGAQSVFAASPLDELAIQDKGRVKPLQSFAEETLQLIHGKRTIKPHDSKDAKQAKVKREASEILLTFMLAPEQWIQNKIIVVDNLKLKKALGFELDEKYFSLQDVLSSKHLQPLVQELDNKRKNEETLNPFFEALQKLEAQVGYIRYIQSGEAFRFVPPKTGDTWLHVHELEPELQEKFSKVLAMFIEYISNKVQQNDQVESSRVALTAAVKDFKTAARAHNPEVYPKEKILDYELTYNKLRPFRLAWIFYLVAFLGILFSWTLNQEWLYKISWVFSFMGLGVHAYGFVLRTLISGRAPVSNMYETVIWVPLGAMVFGMIIEMYLKNKFTILSANLAAFLGLLVASLAPTILDPSIQPLEAVLRSNFWLSTHVTTITISYSAFFLAFVLGDINMVYFILSPKKWAKRIRTINDSIYRSVQIGVLLLAIGIVLGGVWADYSWGRFWGWDPKETWALIALLGYLAVLHAKLVGWVKQFGMSASAVAAFSLVIMAWYGVNYVLGKGLHSYGFGAGGVEYVSVFILLHFLLVGFAWFIKEKHIKAS